MFVSHICPDTIKSHQTHLAQMERVYKMIYLNKSSGFAMQASSMLVVAQRILMNRKHWGPVQHHICLLLSLRQYKPITLCSDVETPGQGFSPLCFWPGSLEEDTSTLRLSWSTLATAYQTTKYNIVQFIRTRTRSLCRTSRRELHTGGGIKQT